MIDIILRQIPRCLRRGWFICLCSFLRYFGSFRLPYSMLPYPIGFFLRKLFFSPKLLFLTFGGAYAVLAYIAQAGVEQYAWLTGPQMIDGLGLAETTPGPLIMVVQFVGFMAGWNYAGGMEPGNRGSDRFPGRHLFHFSALFSIHISWRPLHRKISRQCETLIDPFEHHRRCGRRCA